MNESFGDGRIARLEKALLMAATHCQGGHSDVGMAIAEVLGTPFPVSMDGLLIVAKARGYDPKALWPWWWKAADHALEREEKSHPQALSEPQP